MFDERLFYFVHGCVAMYFLMAGVYRVRRKEASRLERLCGYVLLWWFMLEAKDLIYYFAPVFRYNYLSNLLILIDMTAVSAGCFFVIEILESGWCTLKRALLLVSPYLLAALFYALTRAEWIVVAAFVFTFFYTIGFVIYSIRAVRRYNRLLNENYSNFEYVHVRWLRGVMVMLACCLILWTISCNYSSWIVDTCYQMLLMLMWMTTLYFADRQRVPQIEASPVLPEKGGSETSPLNDLLEQKLAQLLDEERVWMNPHLTLSDLAMQVGTNRTYLSNYLNNTLQTTFYDYINGYRLRAALKLLDAGVQEMTMAELAESCGFNSTSTFRRVFVRATGCSFVEYRDKIVSR